MNNDNNLKIIAHRGFWKDESEKNTMTAFRRAVEFGYGFETDFRDCAQKIVISHNPPTGKEVSADEVFKMYHESGSDAPLALDIKADGLQEMMLALLNKYKVRNYFMVDMSICDTIVYVEKKINIASRSSEFEPNLPFYNDSKVVWIDYFDGRSIIEEEMNRYISDGKIPCVVSPELHNLPYKDMWKSIKNNIKGKYYICTDFPDEAQKFFK